MSPSMGQLICTSVEIGRERMDGGKYIPNAEFEMLLDMSRENIELHIAMANPPEVPYDVNFCLPVPTLLENERIRLVPFIPHTHAKEFFDAVKPHTYLYDHFPYGPFKSLEEFQLFYESYIEKNSASMMFAIYNKSGENGSTNTLTGSIGYLKASPQHMSVEIGHLVILPAFQRTHVTSNAIGLLLHYALDLPSLGGLGLRRATWKANAQNERSVRAAERMGFRMEGIVRWGRALPPGRVINNGKVERAGDPKPGCGGMDVAVFGLCWDDWDFGGREQVDAVMARTS